MIHDIFLIARAIAALICCICFIKAALVDRDTHKTIFYGILILMAK